MDHSPDAANAHLASKDGEPLKAGQPGEISTNSVSPTDEGKPVPRSAEPLQPYTEHEPMGYGAAVDGPANAALSTASDSSQTGFETGAQDHTDDHWHDHHSEYPEAEYYHQHNEAEAVAAPLTVVSAGGGGGRGGSGGSEEHDEDDGGGPVKGFFEHLEDLRWVLMKIAVAVVVGMMVCLTAAPLIVDILQAPLHQAAPNTKLITLGPVEGMVVSMKMSMYAGIAITLPYCLFVLCQYVFPALKRKEREYIRKAIVVAFGLFVIGVLFCYKFILPMSLWGTMRFCEWLHLDTSTWQAEAYFQFVSLLMIGMGLSMEIPVILLTLVRIGVISHEWLVKSRKLIFVINLVIGAVITPDYFSCFFIAVPVQVVLQICIWISAGWERQRKREELEREKAGT